MTPKVIRVIIRAEPTPKGRPRTTMQNGRIWTFTPTKTRNAQAFIREKLERHLAQKFEAYIPVMLTATYYRTKSKYLPRREKMPVRKPDLDNFTKLLLDSVATIKRKGSVTKEGLVADDAQITTVHARKRWSDKGYPYITLRLEEDNTNGY